MNKTIAFIGTGAMGGAMLHAACRTVPPNQIYITDRDSAKAATLAAELGCHIAADNQAAVAAADCVILCIKPQGIESVLQDIAPILLQSRKSNQPKILCSILAGVSIAQMRRILQDEDYPIVRLMPNTPILIGKGLVLYAADKSVSDAAIVEIETILSACGQVERLAESLFDQATVSAGCVPAFAYLFMEALADGGVAIGLPRDKALQYAAKTVYGAAAMVLETGRHPARLKDMVTSPGGSTIAGIAALEDNALRTAAIKAMQAAYQRNLELGNL